MNVEKTFKQNGVLDLEDGIIIKTQTEKDIPKSEQQRKIKVNFYLELVLPKHGKCNVQNEILFFPEQPISDVKKALSHVVGYEPKDIIILKNRVVLRDDKSLKDSGIVDNDALEHKIVPGAASIPTRFSIPGLTH
ncbi:hypothetical protein SAMD00019534_120590 [Acytostelium subglobosum LB1]|uniref:hypothetical protein n=1 Tax=Acytostelium subglobosum LB1 TaxID=1410327 RepID=UPI000644BD95|nr:hypothetical protein SAMD00019534_120590 [Acytostelium subglobosum LB1]GAM28883.1 hypothetical protein SAMD00019534_120590 [Acytostelium subglobosum LB1]|eukprot:XP_012748255.1 hypothetical protein SAMD00019534_120590 [Acytostelium subglobosum LB1]